jgi:hypothetical protein
MADSRGGCNDGFVEHIAWSLVGEGLAGSGVEVLSLTFVGPRHHDPVSVAIVLCPNAPLSAPLPDGAGLRVLTLLPMLALLALVTYAGAVVASHVLPTGLDPVRHALSQYASGARPRPAAVAGTANIVALALLTAALATGVDAPPLTPRGLAPLTLMALTRLGTRALPMDAPGTRPTGRGRAHVLLAMANFVVSVVALQALTGRLNPAPGWHAVAPVLTALAGLASPLLAVVAVCFLVPPLRRVFGLAERLFALDIHGWLLTVAAVMTAHGLGIA